MFVSRRPDPLDTAYGVLLGCLLGAVMWIAAILAVWLMLIWAAS